MQWFEWLHVLLPLCTQFSLLFRFSFLEALKLSVLSKRLLALTLGKIIHAPPFRKREIQWTFQVLGDDLQPAHLSWWLTFPQSEGKEGSRWLRIWITGDLKTSKGIDTGHHITLQGLWLSVKKRISCLLVGYGNVARVKGRRFQTLSANKTTLFQKMKWPTLIPPRMNVLLYSLPT